MATFNDNFVEASDTNLADHTSDSGHGWVDSATAAGCSIMVVESDNDYIRNTSVACTTFNPCTYIDEIPNSPDQVVEVEIYYTGNRPAAGGFCMPGVVLRGENANPDTCYFVHFDLLTSGVARGFGRRMNAGSITGSFPFSDIPEIDIPNVAGFRVSITGTGSTVSIQMELDRGAGYEDWGTWNDTAAERIVSANFIGVQQRQNNCTLNTCGWYLSRMHTESIGSPGVATPLPVLMQHYEQ